MFGYIKIFYNPRRRHGTSDDLSPVEYERRYFQSLTGV
ncbi:transposase [Chromohalobacter japonicus]|uniref:Transposase n=1 Tax=Chromohalobacter japonicus TaxID=223900 RepID=A0A1Q8TEL2_9GAMM|nr:transposase [Chromohalobacter japonicus]